MILIGEMRDAETVRAALSAAETGHFVMSTLHTTDAKETVNRIIDFFPPHEQKQVRLGLADVAARHRVPAAGAPGRRRRAGPCVMEIAVNTPRLAEAIADPDKTDTIEDIIADGQLLRHADLRPAPASALVLDGTVSIARREAGQLQHPRLLGDAEARRASTRRWSTLSGVRCR